MTPRILILYYSFTKQTLRVAESMAERFREHGCDVVLSPIQFVDSRYEMNFPWRPFWPKLLRMIWPELRGKTGAIQVDAESLQGDFDLICLGSPTWWLHPALPVVSFLKSEHARQVLAGRRFAVFAVCRAFWWWNSRKVTKLAERVGGKHVDRAAFVFDGNQIQSMLSFINYVSYGKDRERFWGCRIYAFGVTSKGLEKARSFATELFNQLKPVHSKSEDQPMTTQQFIGTWRLVSSEMVSEGHTVYPLGENCQGILVFDAAGKLAAQLMNPDRRQFASNDILQGTPEEIQAAYQGYVAFYGDYTVDPTAGIMQYKVTGSLYPNWIGHSQERFYEINGNTLTLKTTPVLVHGKEMVGVLVWEKVEA